MVWESGNNRTKSGNTLTAKPDIKSFVSGLCENGWLHKVDLGNWGMGIRGGLTFHQISSCVFLNSWDLFSKCYINL